MTINLMADETPKKKEAISNDKTTTYTPFYARTTLDMMSDILINDI